MKRAILITAALVAIVVLVYGCVIKLWDGGYDLTVNVSATADAPKWVYCYPTFDREMAQENLRLATSAKKDILRQGGYGPFADPFDGRPLIVYVRLSGRRSPIFGELGETQAGHFLVVIAEMPDGRRVGKIAEIPDYRQSQEISISIP